MRCTQSTLLVAELFVVLSRQKRHRDGSLLPITILLAMGARSRCFVQRRSRSKKDIASTVFVIYTSDFEAICIDGFHQIMTFFLPSVTAGSVCALLLLYHIIYACVGCLTSTVLIFAQYLLMSGPLTHHTHTENQNPTHETKPDKITQRTPCFILGI